jgi:hypothetical protein
VIASPIVPSLALPPAAVPDVPAMAVVATLGLGGVVVVAAVAGVVLRRRAARWEADAGRWWEITSPSRPTPGSAVSVWQAIGGVLRRTDRHGRLPRRVALEILAAPAAPTDTGALGAGSVRVGVWVPPGMPGVTLVAALRAALPGAVITPTEAGSPWPSTVSAAGKARAVSVVELRPAGGVWAPLLDPAANPRPGTGGSGGVGGGAGGWGSPRGEAEPLRAVFAALARCAAAQRTGDVSGVQVVVRATRTTGVALLAGAGGRGLAGGLVGVLARAGSVLALELLDVFTPGRAATGVRGSGGAVRGPVDPVQAAAVKARDAKRAAGPHLAVTLRVAAVTPAGVPEAVRRGRVAAILGGYDLITTPLRAHPARGPRAALRLAARLPGAWFAATTGELAAMWHLPADPARHGLAHPPARDLTPPRMLPQIPERPSHAR